MSDTSADTGTIEAATKRLSAALNALQAAADQCREVDLGEQDLATHVQALDDDRSRLASDLDAAVARSRALETTNREIARRIDTAIDNIRSVLDAHDR